MSCVAWVRLDHENRGRIVRSDGPRTIWRQLCYICSMSEVASRELRNDTAGLLRRVQAGEEITVTVNGKAVARLTTLQPTRRRLLTRDELVRRLDRAQADPALRVELAALAGDTTDDLEPLP